MNLVRKMRVMRVGKSNYAQRGVAAVEFALTLPLWVTLLLGTSDLSYCMVINERVDRIAYSVTDIVSQYQTINLANLADIVVAASELMKPVVFGNDGVVIVTSVYKASGQVPKICWQYKGGGALTRGSKIGTANGAAACANGANATLPNGLTMNDNENIIISEVYYKFTPMFLSANLLSPNDVYRVAVYKPRLSPLITPPI